MPETTDRLRFRYLWIAIGVAYIAFIVWVSLVPSPPAQDLPVNDKLVHWLMYFILMLWFVQVSESFEERAALATAFIILGLSLEYMQGMGEARSREIADGVADTLGVLAAAALGRTPAARLLRRFEAMLVEKGAD